MKLLFDENISPKLPHLLGVLFPGSAHVRDCGLKGKSDEEIWAYARIHGYNLVSKDSDFELRSVLLGSPPKLLWIRLGNCTTIQLANLLRDNHQAVQAWEAALESVLILS
jgi:predicted nuclease of predicted toxin-antitoxin system